MPEEPEPGTNWLYVAAIVATLLIVIGLVVAYSVYRSHVICGMGNGCP